MDLFKKYRQMNIDGSLINLEYSEITVPYYCYPVGATAIGFEGCILYCFLPQYEDIVFASDPENYISQKVFPLARNFQDFMRLIITCGSANLVEQIIVLSKEQFGECLQKAKENLTKEQIELIERLRCELQLSEMADSYEYVKELQAGFDYSKIHYSDDFYESMGLEAPRRGRKSTKKIDHDFDSITYIKIKKD